MSEMKFQVLQREKFLKDCTLLYESSDLYELLTKYPIKDGNGEPNYNYMYMGYDSSSNRYLDVSFFDLINFIKMYEANNFNYVLIKFEKNYADEFDVVGFHVSPAVVWEEDVEEARNYFLNGGNPVEVYFGANEALVFEDFDDFNRAYTTKPLTIDEAKVLFDCFDSKLRSSFKLLYTCTYGEFIIPDEYEYS